jgi:uncharacterized membrane protein (DUF106 family)
MRYLFLFILLAFNINFASAAAFPNVNTSTEPKKVEKKVLHKKKNANHFQALKTKKLERQEKRSEITPGQGRMLGITVLLILFLALFLVIGLLGLLFTAIFGGPIWLYIMFGIFVGVPVLAFLVFWIGSYF